MSGDEFLLFGIPAVVFLISGLLGYFSGKARNKRALGWIAGLWIAFTGLMFAGAANAPGWDALAYVAALIGLAAPSGVGSFVGGVIGWVRQGGATPA